MNITVIILTFNESCHIKRAITSVKSLAKKIIVVDSGSTDDTLEIAQQLRVEVKKNKWTNHARQFNWALSQLPGDTEWVFRLDADEIVTPELAQEIRRRLPTLGPKVTGVYIKRRIVFLGRPIRFGGIFPIHVIRLFRYGHGQCEDRWMDEHIVVRGETTKFDGEILDDNQKPLTWWIQKHNEYANREAAELLRVKNIHSERDRSAIHTSARRWLKNEVYARLPLGVRAFLYFGYRYVLRLGFLDGTRGTIFHVLQALWYRFLVDAKIYEVKQRAKQRKISQEEAAREILGIELDRSRGHGKREKE